MRILLIDYLCPFGHKNFDKIHIAALLSLGHNLTFIGKKHYCSEVVDSENVEIINLPNLFSINIGFCKPLLDRFQDILTLLYIKYNQRRFLYDCTIFLSYDILSIVVYQSKRPVILINHNNVGQLDNRIKFVLTRLYKKCVHICLSYTMLERLRFLFPTRKIHYVPHGLISPSLAIRRPSYMHEGELFLFCPVNNNFNQDIILGILNSEELNHYLNSNGIVLYTKPINGLFAHGNIRIIGSRMLEEEYCYLIKESLSVILPYTNEFKYRCSGILFECMAFHSSVICYNNPSMLEFRNICNMSVFDNVSELISCIEKCREIPKNKYDLTTYKPSNYWNKVLSNL